MVSVSFLGCLLYSWAHLLLQSAKAFSVPDIPKSPSKKSLAGGRAPSIAEQLNQDPDAPWEATPSLPSQARLIILQITDVYTLEHLASFKTLLEETRAKAEGATVVCMLTGDFLSPYLLSSVDRGNGMMKAMNGIPMDYLTWGNHEADISHRTVCRHVREFQGTWLNSNMLDHAEMAHQKEFDVINLESPDGTNSKRVGLCAVLSDAEGLYAHFKDPGAFGGAHVGDPWEALTKYKKVLEDDEGCDLVVPLQHLYVPDDHKTCRDFDFPVILSGHDHHKVDEVVSGTRLLKPGMNGQYATVLDISWLSESQAKPEIQARFVNCSQWEPDPAMEETNERAYDVLLPMRNTELARVPSSFEPLSSNGSRESVCTMGKYVCSLIKSSMNLTRRQRKHQIDAVLLMGGNIRGNTDYDLGSFFSLEALEAEIKSDEVIAVVPMPGWLLAEGVQVTHAGDPISGWMQYDVGVIEDTSVHPPVVTHVGGKPIDKDRVYRVATKISDLTNGQSPPWVDYYTENKHVLPPKGAYVNIHAELMSYFARNLWRKLWDSISADLGDEECSIADDFDCQADERLSLLDLSGDGEIGVDEIQRALRDRLGYSVDDREPTLAQFVHSFADTTGNGKITLEDLVLFCDEMCEVYERDERRLSSEKSSTLQKQA